MYSEYIYNTVKQTLQNDLNLETNDNEGQIIVPKVSIKTSLRTFTTVIRVRENDCYFYAYYDGFGIKSENMNKVAELLMKINSNYIYPYLLLDYKNMIVYSRYMPTISEESCNKTKIEDAFYGVGAQLQRWAEAILSVSLGYESPDEAISKVKIP